MDVTLFLGINRFARETPWLHGFLAAYALWGGLVALGVVLLVGWWLVRRRPDAPGAVATAGLTGVATVAALLLNQHVVSPLVGRVRPCHSLRHIEVLLPCNGDYSMPSDHCVIAGVFVVGLWVLSRATGALATMLALLLAFGRVYVGVHYPSDTIVGIAVGGVALAVIVLALRMPATRLTAWLARTRAHGLVTPRAVNGQRQPRHADYP